MKKSTKPESKPRTKGRLPEVLPPRYDIVFKQVFANRPDLLKPFLKAMIGLPEDDYGRVVVVDPHIYPEYKGDKLGVLDIKVVLRSKKVIDVEMQQKKVAHLRERVVFYCAGMVREQVVTADNYSKIKRVVSIAITNHTVIPEDTEYHHRYTLYDPKTGSEFTDLIEVHVIELPKLPKADDGSDLWWWMKFLTVETKEDLAMVAKKSTAMKKAADRLVLVTKDMRIRARLESQRLFEMDQQVMLDDALEIGLKRGRRKGRAEGREEGREEEREKIVSLIEQGVSLTGIKKILSKEKTPKKKRP